MKKDFGKKLYSLRIDKYLLNELKLLAFRKKVTVSSIIIRAVTKFIYENKNNKGE